MRKRSTTRLRLQRSEIKILARIELRDVGGGGHTDHCLTQNCDPNQCQGQVTRDGDWDINGSRCC